MDEFKKQVSALTERLEQTATTSDLEALEERLKKQIDENSPNAVFWSITKIAAGIVSIAAAVGVFLALTKVLGR
jgi:quinol-cytochrome oxidoreductase complex cytochrome b subunit